MLAAWVRRHRFNSLKDNDLNNLLSSLQSEDTSGMDLWDMHKGALKA